MRRFVNRICQSRQWAAMAFFSRLKSSCKKRTVTIASASSTLFVTSVYLEKQEQANYKPAEFPWNISHFNCFERLNLGSGISRGLSWFPVADHCTRSPNPRFDQLVNESFVMTHYFKDITLFIKWITYPIILTALSSRYIRNHASL